MVVAPQFDLPATRLFVDRLAAQNEPPIDLRRPRPGQFEEEPVRRRGGNLEGEGQHAVGILLSGQRPLRAEPPGAFDEDPQAAVAARSDGRGLIWGFGDLEI